jgi:porphobilinogen synthase
MEGVDRKMKNQSLSLRRLRLNQHIRELSRETRVHAEQLIQPLFTVEGLKERQPVPGITGTFRENEDSLLGRVENDLEAGVTKFLLFGVPAAKSADKFSYRYTAKQISTLKKRFGDSLWLAVDVCLCSHTESGQCGILNEEGDHLENSATVSELARAAREYAEAGADCVAPSDMMDGRVAAIRQSLDQAGLEKTLLMSYSAKFHSRFYGPFRVAADSAPKGGAAGGLKLKDRASYQIDPARPADALASSLRDLEEGADILMVKPGMPYLDVLAKLSAEIPERPWAVYEVSGEYAAIELLAREGLMDARAAHLEAWTAFARAGASMIITYGARFARKWLEE